MRSERRLYEVCYHVYASDEEVVSLPGTCLWLVGLVVLSLYTIRRLILGDCAPEDQSRRCLSLNSSQSCA